MTTALVIVHLTSMDSYRDREGRDAAEVLRSQMVFAIQEHRGPVYVLIDPNWDAYTQPYKSVMMAAKSMGAKIVRAGDSGKGWDYVAGPFVRRLKRDGVTGVIIGGIWYTPRSQDGRCVNCVLEILEKNGIRVKVDMDIVGQEDDGEDYTT